MKNFLLFFALILSYNQVSAQNLYSKEKNIQTTYESESIRTLTTIAPISNRVYITYLLWTMDGTGLDYPSEVLKIIPNLNVEINDRSIEEFYNSENIFKYIFDNTDASVKNYVFNPKFIDYPVIGLNKAQVFKLNKWLTDRFNENNLIEKGFYSFNPFQISDNCFVTESYVLGQYYGSRLTDSTLNWNYKQFAPLFRLPTISDLEKSQSFDWRNFDDNSSVLEFIKPWSDYYLVKVNPKQIKMNKSVLFLNSKSLTLERPSQDWIIEKDSLIELTFDKPINSIYSINGIIYTNYSLIEDYKISYSDGKDYPEKNKLSQMDFLIIGTDSTSNSLVIGNEIEYKLEMNSNKYTYFRFSVDVKK